MKRLLSFPFLIGALVVAAALGTLPSGYYVVSPGGSYEVGPRLEIPAERRREMGRLALTAVYAQAGSWVEVALARLSRTSEVEPADEVRPRGISEEEYREINRRLIEESKQVAAVVGLRAAGYSARVTGQGAEVISVLEGMPAAEVLREGDVVVAVDGQPAGTATESVEQIRRRQVGDQVRLTIVRDGQQQEVVVGTKSSPSEPGRPIVGASITTRLFDVELPFPVQITTGNVGGSSAGLIFSLSILDAVTDGVLTRGYFVAGTGTISPDGTVGPIGGAAQKVFAAERDGAQVFLVPRENAADARRAARAIRVVEVDRFEDAIRALCGLEPLPDAAGPPPAPCASSPG